MGPSFKATTVTTANNPPAAIASVSESGPDVTVTTSAAHGFILGQRVTISGVSVPQYNGTFTIEAIPSTTTFQYQISSPVLGTQRIGLPPVTTAGGTATGATATVTTAVPHNLAVGEPVTLSNVTVPGVAITSMADALPTAAGAVPGTGIVTVTTSAAHGLIVGEQVVISGTSCGEHRRLLPAPANYLQRHLHRAVRPRPPRPSPISSLPAWPPPPAPPPRRPTATTAPSSSRASSPPRPSPTPRLPARSMPTRVRRL